MNPWQKAIDQQRILAHIGIAADGVSDEEASRQLAELINWHVKVATDPAVNGGFVLVPVEPTEAMLSAGRTAVMARECSGPLWGAGDHYEAGGYSTDGIPPRLLEGKGKMSKAHCAELAYSAMLAARPETPDA